MRKIVIHCVTNQAGTDSWEFIEVEDSYTDEDLEKLADEVALTNAEMYGIYPPDYSVDADEEDEEGDENIQGVWYDYVPELHDMHTRMGQPNWD